MADSPLKPHGLVLFGHGARDTRWAQPFERLREQLSQARASAVHAGPVALAYLELMSPTLAEAIEAQRDMRCQTITVIPIFFGQGGHLRRDLPALLDTCRARFPELDLRCTHAVGEDDSVLAAIASFCLRQID